jgi:sugar phosphate isomerase/epimerase
MSRRGADNRQRELTLSARFNEREAEAIRQMADHAGVSVAAVIPGAVLNAPIPRAARRPRVNHEMVARVLGELGRIADILRAAAMAI